MRSFLSKLFILSILLGLTNACVNNADDEKIPATNPPLYKDTSVRISIDKPEIISTKTSRAYGSGGKLPYTFSLVSGSGSVDSLTGVYTPAIGFSGTAVIRVVDALNQSATDSVTVYPILAITPSSATLYVTQSQLLTVSGGKPPYDIKQTIGGGTPTITATDITVNAPATQDAIIVTVTDALFNTATASIVVLPPLSVSTSATLYPSFDSDGNPQKVKINVLGGNPDAALGYDVTLLTGNGTLTKVDSATWEFDVTSAYMNDEQSGAGQIKVSVKDANASEVFATFGFFVPMKVSAGGIHTCALNNSNSAGQVKCWGDGIHGQLGYGDDKYSQAYWGDCTNCSEDSNVATTNTENFLPVEFLTAAEKAAGATIIDYSYGQEMLCAIVSTDASDLVRTVRCLGSNTYPNYAFDSRLSVYSTFFPFSLTRNRRYNFQSGGVSGTDLSATNYSIGNLYRTSSTDDLFLSTSYTYGSFFPRTFNVLPNSGLYQKHKPDQLSSFGLITTNGSSSTPLSQTYQNPSSFSFFNFLDAAWRLNKIKVLSRTDNGNHYGHYFTLLGDRKSDATKVYIPLYLSGSYSTSFPYVNQNTPAYTDYTVYDSDLHVYAGLVDYATGNSYSGNDSCFIGDNKYIYCIGPNICPSGEAGCAGYLGINDPIQTITTTFAGAKHATTTIGGDADEAYAVVKTSIDAGGNNNVVCGIFDGNAAVGTDDRLVACWGKTSSGLLGTGVNADNSIYARPVQKASGGNLTNVQKIDINYYNACALTATNQLYCWGYATGGRLPGYAATQNKAVLINTGANDTVIDFALSPNTRKNGFGSDGATCAIIYNTVTTNKSLKCWGSSSVYDYSIPKPSVGYYSSMPITEYNVGTIDPIQIQISTTGGCMLPSDRKALKCWGDNRTGVFGIGNSVRGNKPGDMSYLPLVNLGTGKKVKQMSSGLESNCAILNDDRLKCWGSNLFGETGQGASVVGLGNGSAATHIGVNANQMGDFLNPISFTGDPDSKVKIVKNGGDHVCAVTNSNNLYCWGENVLGQIGQQSSTAYFSSPKKVTLPDSNPVTQIALGLDHTCALTDDGSTQNLYCWGSNENGQLGYGDLTSILPGGLSAHTNNHVGDSATDIAVSSLPPVFLGGVKIKQIEAAQFNTCILFTNGRIRCFGKDNYGQVGIGTYDNDSNGTNDDMGVKLSETGYKYLVSLGTNPATQAPYLTIRLTMGSDFTCALLEDYKVKCWGLNKQGQLGMQDTQNRGVNSGEMGDSLPFVNIEPGQTVLSMSAGTTHTCAVLANNKMKCWGGNFSGQLGIDVDYSRGGYPYTMGSSLPYTKIGF